MGNILLTIALIIFMCVSVVSQNSRIIFCKRSSSVALTPATQVSSADFNSAQIDADKIIINNAWIQEGPPSQRITAAFMVIENQNTTEISLLSASVDVAPVVELHKMELEDGMMRMRRVDSIDIPSGGTVELKPGSYHLMVIGVTRELKEGDKVKVTLRFSNNIQKSLNVPVKKRSSVSQEEGGR